MKTATLESKFPLLAVENGCIISKDADITVAYRVELPELFTLTRAEYESMHSTWAKAVKVLPNYSIVHKQDFFIEEGYKPDICKEDLSFLSRSFERHFNERPYLQHTCYLFLTKTTKEHSRTTSSFNALTRGFIIPKEMQDKETVTRFMECCGQFERIVNDSGLLRIIRLTDEEIIGSNNSAGIIEKYFSMSQEDATCLQDLSLGAGEMKVGDNYLCLHTLSDPEDLPSNVSTDCRYERLSTDRSDCRLSFAAPIGILLTCNHVVNQYLFIDDSAEILRKFEQTARNMHSLSRYSRSNQINREWIEEYLNEAHSKGLVSIRAHCNVMAWSDDREKLKRIKNDVGSQLALMEAKPRHNTVDVPTLFWAAIPGNAGDFPVRGEFPHLYRAGPVPVHRGNLLQGLALPVRHPYGGPPDRKTRPSGYFRPADEERHNHEPEQIHPRTFGQREIFFHQPHGTPVLRAGCACAVGGYRKLLSGTVQPYPCQDTRRGRDLFYL